VLTCALVHIHSVVPLPAAERPTDPMLSPHGASDEEVDHEDVDVAVADAGATPSPRGAADEEIDHEDVDVAVADGGAVPSPRGAADEAIGLEHVDVAVAGADGGAAAAAACTAAEVAQVCDTLVKHRMNPLYMCVYIYI